MDSSIEGYFSSNFVPGTLDKLKQVLSHKLFISGSREGHSTDIYGQQVSLLFAHSIEELLSPEGSVYDYIVLSRERYQAAPPLEQIEGIIAKKKQEPKYLRYEIISDKDVTKNFGPVLIPYEKVKEVIALLDSEK